MVVVWLVVFVQLVLLLGVFVVLIVVFVVQDFLVWYVVENFNLLLLMVYCYLVVWGVYEGFLLLWVLVLVLWSGVVVLWFRWLLFDVCVCVFGVFGIISIGFLVFLIFIFNLFVWLLLVLFEGCDLNLLLQDFGLIIYLLMLYLGYVGFVVLFVFVIVVLLEGCVDVCWLCWIWLWINVVWGFLIFGIVLGSWWVYYEFGWGGWWFWDLVENVSFLLWLVGVVLIYFQVVIEKCGSFVSWILLLVIVVFVLLLLGIFLVCLGVFISVYLFVVDFLCGIFILVFLVLVVGGVLLLYVLCVGVLGNDDFWCGFMLILCEILLLVNNLLLVVVCGMVLFGILYLLLVDVFGLGKVLVGLLYFGILFVVLMVFLVVLLLFGLLVNWQCDQVLCVLVMFVLWVVLLLLLGVIVYFMVLQGVFKIVVGVVVVVWVVLGIVCFVWICLCGNGCFNVEMVGMLLVYGGVVVFLVGVLLVEVFNVQCEVVFVLGQVVQVGVYEFCFEGVDYQQGLNYSVDCGYVCVLCYGCELVLLYLEKCVYVSGGQVMIEVGIYVCISGDVYVVLGELLGNNVWVVCVYIKLFVCWIWLGVLLMVLGGFVIVVDCCFCCLQEFLCLIFVLFCFVCCYWL